LKLTKPTKRTERAEEKQKSENYERGVQRTRAGNCNSRKTLIDRQPSRLFVRKFVMWMYMYLAYSLNCIHHFASFLLYRGWNEKRGLPPRVGPEIDMRLLGFDQGA